jgi:hypothetical protein
MKARLLHTGAHKKGHENNKAAVAGLATWNARLLESPSQTAAGQ